jgi:HAD superfamily hydrolase (TIGR01509 family)
MIERSVPALIIFDCDGVLVDSEPIAARVLATEASRVGIHISAEDCLRRFTGVSMKAVLAALEADLGQPLPKDFESRVREADFAAFRSELKPMEGIQASLQELPLRKCVASSGSIEKIRFTLGVTGLLPLFEPHLFSADMVARGKPAPDLFLHAAREMATASSQCIVIEDSVAGVTAALAAGMRVFGFVGGGHCLDGYREKLEAAGAERLFARMAELPGLLVNPPMHADDDVLK